MGDRAVFDTAAASGAEVCSDAACAFPYLDLEISSSALDGFKIRIGDEFDVQVPADLDQFGRDDSHGAVIGGKGLV